MIVRLSETNASQDAMVLLHVKIDATMTTLTNAVTTVLVTPIVQTVVHVTMSSANLTVQMVQAQTQLHHQTASKAMAPLKNNVEMRALTNLMIVSRSA